MPEGDMEGIGREKASMKSLQLSPNATLLTYQETGNLGHNGGLEVVEEKLLYWTWGLLHRREFMTVTISSVKSATILEVMESR